MGRFLRLFILQLAFWMGFFEVGRLIFVIYHKTNPFSIKVLPVFIHSLRLDFSTSCYLSALPFVLMILHLLANLSVRWAIKIYYLLFVPVVALILISDAELYRKWGSKINPQAITYLKYPKEALNSSLSSPLFWLIITWLILSAIGLYSILKILSHNQAERIPNTYLNMLKKSILSVIFISAFLMGMRGGFQLTPVNQSSAYFSNNSFLNCASVNTIWNLIDGMVKERKAYKYRVHYLPETKVASIINDLSTKRVGDSDTVLITNRPNIILVVMENFSADLIATLGGEKGISPGFELLSKEGLLFTNLYASGDRTDKGLASILCAFPALPFTSVLKDPSKFEKLPALPNKLKSIGYTTSFYYGGESEFFNFKAFSLHCGFENIVDKSSFKSSQIKSTWGAHDDVLFSRFLSDYQKAKSPFFATILTLSNHEPFESPIKPKFDGNDDKNLFKNTAYYADQSLYEFISKAKTASWFNNTLFIFVADHGNEILRTSSDPSFPERHHIPMLWYGNVLQKSCKGQKIDVICSQTDLTATLLRQLNLKSDEFIWSRDIFGNPKPFAFYSSQNRVGWVNRTNPFSLDIINDKVVYSKGSTVSASSKDTVKAYLQKLMDVYSRL